MAELIFENHPLAKHPNLEYTSVEIRTDDTDGTRFVVNTKNNFYNLQGLSDLVELLSGVIEKHRPPITDESAEELVSDEADL